MNFRASDENPSGEIVLPRNSTWLTPKWHFSIFSFNPVGRMHLKTARRFGVKSVALLAAIPMSSTF